MSSQESFGTIDDGRTYSHTQIAAIYRRRDKWAKDFIREHVSHADIGNGLLLVSGQRWRLAIESLSDLTCDGCGKHPYGSGKSRCTCDDDEET